MKRLLGYVWAILALLLAWQALAWAIATPALPGPVTAIAALVQQLRGTLWRDVLVSAARATAAVVIALVLGAPLGLWLGQSPRADRIAAPIIYLTYPIPKVVFLTVIFILIGIGDVSKVLLIVLVIVFQVLVSARDASRRIPAEHILSARSLGATPAGIYRHVVVPATLPAIFTATRISIGVAIAVLYLAESFASSDGLGYRILDAEGRFAYAEMFAAILALALVGVILYEIIEALEVRMCAWARLEEPTP